MKYFLFFLCRVTIPVLSLKSLNCGKNLAFNISMRRWQDEFIFIFSYLIFLNIFLTSLCWFCQEWCVRSSHGISVLPAQDAGQSTQGWVWEGGAIPVTLTLLCPPLCGFISSGLGSPEDVWMMKRDCSLFLCPSLPPLSSALLPLWDAQNWDFWWVVDVQGMIIIISSAGNLHLLVLVRINKNLLNDLVTWCRSIVYLIKMWPIQLHTTCLVLFVAWLPAKAFLNRPCVSYCGGRHLSIDSVLSCRVSRFGRFWFCYYSFLTLIFPFSHHLPLLLGVNFVGILSWLIKTPVQVSVRNKQLEIWLLSQSFSSSP